MNIIFVIETFIILTSNIRILTDVLNYSFTRYFWEKTWKVNVILFPFFPLFRNFLLTSHHQAELQKSN